MSSLVCDNVVFKKQFGTLKALDDSMVWVGADAGSNSVVVKYKDVHDLQVSKAGSEKTALKVVVGEESRQESLLFLFSHEEPSERVIWRDKFKELISEKRLEMSSSAAALLLDKECEENARKELLNDGKIAESYKELVSTGLLTSEEFWVMRKDMLELQKRQFLQEKGIPSSILVDIRPVSTGSQIKYTLTPELISMLFKQYPIVEKLFRENVPGTLTESEFWAQFFQSDFYIGKKVAKETFQENIFNKWQKSRGGAASGSLEYSSFVDIERTVNDHQQRVDDLNPKSKVSLFQKLNEYSVNILRTNREKPRPEKIEDVIEIEDLNDPSPPLFTSVKIDNPEGLFEQPEFPEHGDLAQFKQELSQYLEIKGAEPITTQTVFEYDRETYSSLAELYESQPEKSCIDDDLCKHLMIRATELLSMFWGISPPMTPEKLIRKEKVAGLLFKVLESINEVVRGKDTSTSDWNVNALQQTQRAIRKTIGGGK